MSAPEVADLLQQLAATRKTDEDTRSRLPVGGEGE